MTDRISESAGPLQIEDVTRRYGSLTAVDRIALTAQSGEILIFLGPNGSGKTTLLRMICGLLKADNGKIRVFGEEVGGRRKRSRLRIGYCPQALIVWKDLTCLEQLVFMAEMYGLSRRQSGIAARKLVADFGLSNKAETQAGRLSGGMQRRLNLALAMIHDPPILVLDEPTAGLDPQSRLLVRDMIRSMAEHREKTVLMATHDIDEAERLAHRVAIMNQGRLLKLGSPESLIKDTLSGVRAEDPTKEESGGFRKAAPSLEDVFFDLTGRRLEG
ncbi:MAG: ABC transporter ATP-binding protein [Proteobacteria bacterium]|nr:ABC transporter ATP-binding protein [Pseudomonadota bacterium]